MALRTDTFDLGGLRLTTGEGRELDLTVGLDPLVLGGERYAANPAMVPVRLGISRMSGSGYALRLRFDATVEGPCMRCLETAAPTFTVDAREVSQQQDDSRAAHSGEAGSRAGRRREEGEELSSPYMEDEVLDLHAWARDALALALPPKLLCKEDCAGLCPLCGADLNAAGPEHQHERSPDPRWAKLSELHFE